MHSPTPSTSARLARRSAAAALVLALCTALLLAAAAPASAGTREQAAKKTFAALGKSKSSTRARSSSSRRFSYRARRRPARMGRQPKGRMFQSDPFGPGTSLTDLAALDVFSRTTQSSFTSQSDPEGDGNQPPTANDQNVIVKQDTPKNITLTGSDPDGDPLIFEIARPPEHGKLSGQPPNVTYTPDRGFLGTDAFTFRVTDGESESAPANVTLDVVARGEPPVVEMSAGCTDYREQAPAVEVDRELRLFDPDDTVLDSARVRIASELQGGDDLLFTDQKGISGSYDDSTGTLTLTGDASVDTYEAALRSVRYRNLASGNPTKTKDIEFTVNDAGADSKPATKQICVAPDNDPPIGEVGEGVLTYTENDGPVPLDGGFVVGDPDSANLSGATIKFVPHCTTPVDPDGNPTGPPVCTNTFAPAEDELAFVNQSGITGNYNDSTGVLTLSGSASLAAYETAIRSVKYENVSEKPSDAIRRLEFQVTDSSGASSTPHRRDIYVTPVNDAPRVTTTSGVTSYIAGGPAVAVDPKLTILDVDDGNIEGALVRISDGFSSGDELLFVDQNGIFGSYDARRGILKLGGTASVADYEAALRSIEYQDVRGDTSHLRTVEFTVNDGDADSKAAFKSVEVLAR